MNGLCNSQLSYRLVYTQAGNQSLDRFSQPIQSVHLSPIHPNQPHHHLTSSIHFILHRSFLSFFLPIFFPLHQPFPISHSLTRSQLTISPPSHPRFFSPKSPPALAEPRRFGSGVSTNTLPLPRTLLIQGEPPDGKTLSKANL